MTTLTHCAQTDTQTDTQTDRHTDLAVELTSPFGRGQLKRLFEGLKILNSTSLELNFT